MQKFINNFRTQITASIATGSATSCTISSAQATRLGALAAGEYYLLTLSNEAETAHEVIKVTAVNAGSGVLTIVRDTEVTDTSNGDGTGDAWPSGTYISSRISMAGLSYHQGKILTSAPTSSTDLEYAGRIGMYVGTYDNHLWVGLDAGYSCPVNRRIMTDATGVTINMSVAPSTAYGATRVDTDEAKIITINGPDLITIGGTEEIYHEFTIHINVTNAANAITLNSSYSFVWENGTTCPAVAGTATLGDYYVIRLEIGHNGTAYKWLASYKKFNP